MTWIANTLFAGSPIFWWACLLALALSALGFYRVVYFVSLGYAFSIVGITSLATWWFIDSMTWLSFVHCILLACYGIRLAAYLLPRERSASYKEATKQDYDSEQSVKSTGKIAIWLSVSLLYVLMCAPALYHLRALKTNKTLSTLTIGIGLAIMAFGLLLEAIADWQKSQFKKTSPKRYCDQGLYKIVRCPNYLGEMIFWTGNIIAGASALAGFGPWILSIAGLLSIYYIMLYSTHRLERKQRERYGDIEAFQTYTNSVPILLPFVPLYSLDDMPFMLKY